MLTRTADSANRLITSHRGRSWAVAGGLVLALSGLGGCSGSQTDSPSSTTSTSSSSSSSSPESPTSSAPAHELLDEFDGWKKGEVTDVAGHESAIYSKGEDVLSILVMDRSETDDPSKAWPTSEKFGEITCNTESSTPACVGEKDGQVILGTTVSKLTAKEMAKTLTAYLDAM